MQETISLLDLRQLTDEALAALGLSGSDREIVRDVLLFAELSGNNQGLIKIPQKAVQPSPDATPMVVEQPFPAVAHIKGNGQVGMVVMDRAVDVVVDAATNCGIGLVAMSGTSTSTGAIGYFANKIAKAGKIGIVICGTPKAVAVEGGSDPVLGTNPIAISVPYRGGIVSLDMTTAAMAFFGLVQAKARGESIAEGVAYDEDGALTTDPAAALSGAVRSFGGAKGSGLALMVEILTGPLTGADILQEDTKNRGSLILAIDPATFGEAETFETRTATLLDGIKASRPLDADKGIRLPGEGSRGTMEAALASGELKIDSQLLRQLEEIAAS